METKRTLFSMTWPIFLELVLQMLVGNADQFMIGRYSQTGAAAIGNCNQVLNVFLLTFGVVNTATTILISQYKGAENKERMGQTASLALLTNFLISLALGLILVFGSRLIFTWMQLPEEVLEEACTYFRIVGSCIFLPAVFLTMTAIFRSNGWLREALGISAMINVLNIIGNAALIKGFGPLPALGLSGVAISSNFARLAGICVFALLLSRRQESLEVSVRFLKPFPAGQQKRLLSIGIPSGGESLSYTTSQVVILRMINTFGTKVIAAGVYGKMFATLSYLYTSALAQGSQILVGYLTGAGKTDDVDRQTKTTLKTGLAASFCMSLLVYLLSGALFAFFNPDPEVVALGRLIMLIDIPLELGRAVNMILIRSLQAAGDIRFPVISGMICVWAIEVPLSWLFGVRLGFGLPGIWAAMACDELFRACVYLWRWQRGLWRHQRLIEEP
ncbi:MAG: MATE family efflux transporter [Peptococcaceae bacterium]|nr:MATE family efflux transporter [Peptococcaceae bacterium]